MFDLVVVHMLGYHWVGNLTFAAYMVSTTFALSSLIGFYHTYTKELQVQPSPGHRGHRGHHPSITNHHHNHRDYHRPSPTITDHHHHAPLTTCACACH